MAEYLSPPLQGFTLVDGRYHPLTPREDGSLWSQELDLELSPEGATLRLFDPLANRPLPTMDEAVSLMEDALELAQSEPQRAQIAAQRAEAEAQRAEVEAQRAAAAEARSADMEAEIERLRRLLDDLR